MSRARQVVTVLGLPREEPVEGVTLMDWAVQRAQVNENGEVEIVFDQLMLIGMGEETGLLLVAVRADRRVTAQKIYRKAVEA